ncbi:KRR1 small subunit processome component [Tanacetum coccineum]
MFSVYSWLPDIAAKGGSDLGDELQLQALGNVCHRKDGPANVSWMTQYMNEEADAEEFTYVLTNEWKEFFAKSEAKWRLDMGAVMETIKREAFDTKSKGKKHKGKHDKPKPWDEIEVNSWKIDKFEPKDNVGGSLLEESSFSTLFPA